jgi:AraC-like DNA-binding protein
MISAFDLEQLLSVLKDFYRITRIRIAVFDEQFRELIAYPEHRPAFCRLIRSCEAGRRACAQCDQNAGRIASKQRSAYVYRCHAGLTEAIMPLYVGDVLAGYLLFGHIFSYGSYDAGWQVISSFCKDYPVDAAGLEAACRTMPRRDADYIKSAARILHATASYLALERVAVLRQDSAAARLDEYLDRHFTEALDTKCICQALQLGRTRLFQLCRQMYGVGPAEHIRALRIAQAKELLVQRQDMSVSEVGQTCGYSDASYFIAVFAKEVGAPPGLWRRDRCGA